MHGKFSDQSTAHVWALFAISDVIQAVHQITAKQIILVQHFNVATLRESHFIERLDNNS